jgi:flavodoxin
VGRELKRIPIYFLITDKLPQVTDRKAFIFSISGISGEFLQKHSTLRKKLQSKGYIIIDEFNCPGFNSNSFLRFFGGMRKNRPNTEDLKRAEEFALNLKQNLR